MMSPIGEDGGRAGLAGCIDDEIGNVTALHRLAVHHVCGDGGKGCGHGLQVGLDLRLIVIGGKADRRQIPDGNVVGQCAATLGQPVRSGTLDGQVRGSAPRVCAGRVGSRRPIRSQVGGGVEVRNQIGTCCSVGGQIGNGADVRRLVRAAAPVNR
jgi:hypothetical protein